MYDLNLLEKIKLKKLNRMKKITIFKKRNLRKLTEKIEDKAGRVCELLSGYNLQDLGHYVKIEIQKTREESQQNKPTGGV